MNAIKPFKYLGIVFEPLRDFTAAEESYGSLSERTKGFKSVIAVAGYSHAAFFIKAQAMNSMVDLYLMNGKRIVTPGLNGFYEYDLSIPVKPRENPAVTKCCNAAITHTERQENIKAGPYICPICKKPVTMTGQLKKLKKEA